MKKQKKVLNMQRRRKEQPPLPQKNAPKPASPDFNDEQTAEFMAKAEAAFTSTSSQTRYFVHGPMGLQSQQEPDGTWLFPIQDGLGSIRDIADEALSILESREYDPFGNPTDTHGIAQTPFGFTSEITDPNGLVHLRSRYYNPSLGVFPNLDPVEGTPDVPMSLNQYSYAQGNPVNLTDASGMMPNIVNSLWSIPISNPMGLHNLVNSINFGCYGSSPRQQGEPDCSCYQTLDAKYGSGSLYEECLAGHFPACPPSSSPTLICPWDGIPLLSSPVFDNEQLCYYTYNPTDAIRYAERWKGEAQNPLFMNFAGGPGGDCANFVSQSLLYGGLPMRDGWYCANEPCGSLTGGYTPTWTGADPLETYLLGQSSTSIRGEFPMPGIGSTYLAAENSVRTLGANLSGIIGIGDVLHISGPRPHVALIVGWGPYVTDWDAALSQILQATYSDQNPVPYVVDHGPHTGIHTAPRPYYALSWPMHRDDGTNIIFNDYRFVKVPNSIVLSLEEAQQRVPTAFTKANMLNE